MSLEPSSVPERPGTQRPADRASVPPWDDEPSGIRRQAAEIAEIVLADSAPEQASARKLLREHLAVHPGRPEIALAEHLITIRSLPGVRSEVQSVPSASGTPGPETRKSLSSRLERVLKDRTLTTAFQPIRDLTTNTAPVVGVEAFTRVFDEGGDTAEDWFAEASEVQMRSDLEFAALESALASARNLPEHLYVALKLAPATCLDPLLPGLLEESPLALDRMVLELTDALTVEQPAALVAALAPLRRRGLRLAIDHVGSYFDSIRHVRNLRPDIIKLDRNLIHGIPTDIHRYALGEAMVWLAEETGAAVIAEGIETSDELAAVTDIGITAGQGYYLGRPTTRPRDWASWNNPARDHQPLVEADSAGPSSVQAEKTISPSPRNRQRGDRQR
jgi:EAL domain-containing protein (putative c-di-GMP-specific phosphodiesterase class I)